MEYTWWIGVHAFLARAEVAPWEVMEVLYSPRRWPRPARTPAGLPVTTVRGRTDAGRPLVIVMRRPPAPGAAERTDIWEILLAAQMRGHQLEEYTAWEANR